MKGIGEGIAYKSEIFLKMLSIIPTKSLEFCCTDLTLVVIYSASLLKLLIFIKHLSYLYEYSRHYRPVSVIFYSSPKISRRYFILRGNVVTEL